MLRLNDDGSVPQDNPFVGKRGLPPRDLLDGPSQLRWASPCSPTATHEVWLAEMGPNGGDEINVIQAGRNYGWPMVSLGRTYPGPWQAKTNEPTHAGFEPPVVYWTPSISGGRACRSTPATSCRSGRATCSSAGLRYGEVPGTGQLDRVLLNEKLEELRRESLLMDLHQRIRDVKQGPDGLIYVATDESPDGAILRIEPAK